MTDRISDQRVCSGVTFRSSWARALAALTLSLTIACGGGNKSGDTTPKANAGDGSQSMNDPGDPSAPPGGGGGSPSAGDGGSTGGAGGSPGGSGSTSNDGPAIVAPNLDPDPQQARAQVEQHLQVARSALAMATPDAETALREARLALAVDAANVDAAAMVAFAYYHKKLYDTAELVLDDLYKRETAKTNANVNYVYGLVYDKTNRPDRAVLAFQKAVQLNPNLASAWVDLGVHQLRNSQYAEAQQTFERVTKQFNRNDAVTLTSLASAYRGRSADYQAGSPDHDQLVRSAEATYKRAIQVSSNYGPAYYNLGLLYLDNDPFPGMSDPMQRLTTAKQYFDQYKNLAGFDIKLYDTRMKDVDKATKRVQKMLKKKTREAKEAGGGG